jgi:hypothetical protein
MHGRLLLKALVAAGWAAFGWASSASAAYTIVPSPNAFAGNNTLAGVSASSTTDAWAVGSLCCAFRHSGIGTLTEHWTGSAWAIVPSPDTAFNDDELFAVADLAPGNAWAVGLVKQAGFRSGGPLVIHWNGTSWTTATLPSGLTGTLRAVSADSAGDVWAVGDDAHGNAVVLHFNGTTWSTSALPATSGGRLLQGVKAFSPTDVWAVGDGVPNPLSTATQTLVLHWNGTAWSVIASPNPDPNSNILHAIDGRSSSDLWAVGQQAQDETVTGVPPGTRTLAEHWNGQAWKAVPSLNTGDNDTLNGVAASTATSVAAVGTDVLTGGAVPIQRTLVQKWNGTSWISQASANTGATDNLLEGASAVPGGSFVWAVGFSLTASGVDHTLIERGSVS